MEEEMRIILYINYIVKSIRNKLRWKCFDNFLPCACFTFSFHPHYQHYHQHQHRWEMCEMWQKNGNLKQAHGETNFLGQIYASKCGCRFGQKDLKYVRDSKRVNIISFNLILARAYSLKHSHSLKMMYFRI